MKNVSINSLTSIFLALFLLQSCSEKTINPEDYNPEIVIAWNEKVMDMAIAEDGLSTLKGLRTLSLMHIAMHNALNSIVPKYTSYNFTSEKIDGDPLATAAYAAYTIALHQYPNEKEALQEELEHWIKDISKETKEIAKNLGETTAISILQVRYNDGWDTESEYTWHPMAPGVYAEFNEHSGTPEGFIFGAGWAKAEPFMLPKQNYFRSPPPPEIQSESYTQAFNEVKEVGSTKSSTRTKDQDHLAMWWKDFVENSHNRLARQLVEKEQLNLWEASRLFALLNMTVYDAYINVFDNKFHYNHWRPYTAIHWAENDENPDTEPDPEWNNLHLHTYPFPSYPSAHGTASSAAMTVLASTLGTGDEYAFTMVTPEVDKAGLFSEKVKMDPPTRSFSSFSEAAHEAALSRVYLGIHFRYDSEEGVLLGKKIGDYALNNFLKAVEIPKP
ncbi:MAG: vanadium-dependent haloperoxidase [Allomuricauda sp.]